MASQVFQNIDLVRHIYSFGDPSHRTFTFYLKWDLKPWPDVFLQRYMDRQLESGHYGYSIQEYLYEFSNRQIVRLLKQYRRCYCCERHNTNKLIFYNQVVRTPEPMVYESHPTNCLCSCRKLSRIFIAHLSENTLD